MAYEISPDAQAVLTQAGQGAQEYVLGKGGFGNKLTSGEATSLLAGFKPTPTVGQTVQQGIAQLGSQQYQFDPNQYLPGIQATANSVYSPQQAQLEAIRQLQQASYQDQKIQSEKDFAKRMQQEVESINRRGAFFSGGAVQNEQDLRGQFQSQQFQGQLQYAAAQYGNYAQQAALEAEKTQFIQDRLVNADNSAYARWTDARNFSLQALTTQYQVYSQERNFARSVFESDRAYDLQKDQFDMQQKQFEQQYKIDAAQFEMAKKEFNIDLKIKNLSYENALDNFKRKYATDNSGVLGIDSNGTDIEQSIWDSWNKSNSSTIGGFSVGNITGSDFQFGF